MTCEEARACIARPIADFTIAERAVVRRHIVQCPSCTAWALEEAAKNQSEDPLRFAIDTARGNAILARDESDPEYMEVFQKKEAKG